MKLSAMYVRSPDEVVAEAPDGPVLQPLHKGEHVEEREERDDDRVDEGRWFGPRTSTRAQDVDQDREPRYDAGDAAESERQEPAVAGLVVLLLQPPEEDHRAFTPAMAISAATSVIPQSWAITTIISELDREYSTQRNTLRAGSIR